MRDSHEAQNPGEMVESTQCHDVSETGRNGQLSLTTHGGRVYVNILMASPRDRETEGTPVSSGGGTDDSAQITPRLIADTPQLHEMPCDKDMPPLPQTHSTRHIQPSLNTSSDRDTLPQLETCSETPSDQDTTSSLETPKGKRLCLEGDIGGTVTTPNISRDSSEISFSQGTEKRISPQVSVILANCSNSASNESPSFPASSSQADELFLDQIADDDALTEAIFGEAALTISVPADGELLDTTALQIKAARDKMQKDEQKLLSSIEALKGELASKEQLLAKNAEKVKLVEESKKENEAVISSMQEEFTCVICQELFITAYTLPCAHSFCKHCILGWIGSRRSRNCPICRKHITTSPVHSLALDNAIDKMVQKMDASAQAERQRTKELRKNAENTGASRSSASTSAVSPPSSSGNTATATTSSGNTATATTSGGNTATATTSSGNTATATTNSTATRGTNDGTGGGTIIIHNRNGDGGTDTITVNHFTNVVIDGGRIHISRASDDEDSDEEYDSEEDTDEYEDDEDWEDSGPEVPGMPGHYYGGYGICYNCGQCTRRDYYS